MLGAAHDCPVDYSWPLPTSCPTCGLVAKGNVALDWSRGCNWRNGRYAGLVDEDMARKTLVGGEQ